MDKRPRSVVSPSGLRPFLAVSQNAFRPGDPRNGPESRFFFSDPTIIWEKGNLGAPSQVPRPSCEEGRENEGPKTGEFSFHGRLWQKFSLKVEKGAHNWYRQHVNSHFFSDEPSISPLGAAVQLLFSPPLIWAFPSSHLGIPFSAFFNCISFVFGQPFVFLFSD